MEVLTDYSIFNEKPELIQPIGVLDYGEIQLIDFNGGDQRIVDAARVSYRQGTQKIRKDEALIEYLMRKKHWSPFEMTDFTFKIRMPLYLLEQWKRHRTAKMNEESARYSEMESVFNLPETLRVQDPNNRQSSTERMEEGAEKRNRQAMQMQYEAAYASYQDLLEQGVPREQARLVLPVSLYKTFYWKQDLRNLFGLLQDRLNPGAQEEIQAYAQAIAYIISQIVPISYNAFEEHMLYGVHFSRSELKVLQTLVFNITDAEKFLREAAKAQGLRKTLENEFIGKVIGVQT